MNENKLPQSVGGTIAAWIFTALAWLFAHFVVILGLASGAAALIASIYSIRASRQTYRAAHAAEAASEETIRLRIKQRERLTSGGYQDPDTEI